MPDRLCLLAFLLLNATILVAQAAPDGSPERAIQDMLMASRPEEVEKHLPVVTVEAIKALDQEDRRHLEDTLILRSRTPDGKPDIEIPENGHSFVVIHIGSEMQSEVQLEDVVIGGSDAILRFTGGGPSGPSQRIVVWMRYEDGEWRLRELDFGNWREIHFDDPGFVEGFRHTQQKENESAAAGTLFMLNFSLQRYAEVKPETGFPEDLAIMAVPINNSEDESGSDQVPSPVLDSGMARNDFVRDGYRFHYELLRAGPQGGYAITARPIGPSSGRFSYFMDESGQVHQTDEDRNATGDDPPIGA